MPAKKPPPPPDFSNVGGGGGSSGGSSGGSRAKRATVGDFSESNYLSQLAAIYVGLWGTKSPPGYLEGIARRGMNVFEFEAHERAKPAFKFSPRYQEETLSVGQQLSGFFGGLG